MSTRPLCPACQRYAGLLCCPTSDVCGPPGLLRWGGHVCAGACTRVCNAHTWALATTVHACFHISWDLDLEALMVPGSSCCFGLRVVLGGHQAGVGLGPTPAPQPRLHSYSEHGAALPVSHLLHRSHCLPFTSSLTLQLRGLVTLRSHSSRKPCLPPQDSERVCLSQGPCGISWVILSGFPSVPINTP